MSSILGVSPFYYTGEEDEKKELSANTLREYLVHIGCPASTLEFIDQPEARVKRKYTRKNQNAVVDTQSNDIEESIEIDSTDTETVNENNKTNEIPVICKEEILNDTTENVTETAAQTLEHGLTREEINLLLDALIIRARYGGTAESNLEAIKKLLLS